MKLDERPAIVRALFVAWAVGLAAATQVGCGGTGGAWLWWLTDPTEKIEAEYTLGKGRLVILIDDDKGWLADPAIRPLLTEGLIEELGNNKANRNVVGHDELVRLRKKDPKFDRRGAREIGERLKADQVLHLNVREFALRHETVDPAYKGFFVIAVKVLDAHATKAEDVRLWPRSVEGKLVEVTTDLHTGKGSGYDDQLTRRLCREMAVKIAQLFYDHTAPKKL